MKGGGDGEFEKWGRLIWGIPKITGGGGRGGGGWGMVVIDSALLLVLCGLPIGAY